MADYRENTDAQKQREWAIRAEKHELWARRMWRIFYGVLAVLFLSIVTFSFLTPSFKKLEDPSLNLASEVIAGDDTTVLGRIYVQNRAPVTFNQLPKNLLAALIATEDKRFYEHAGVDPEALARVVKGVFLRQKQGGGSTLTMQLAKLLYSDRDFKNMNFLEKALGYYYRKLSEMITAVKLERAYTKEEILTMYLNTYDFGNNAPGIRAASEVYFAKKPENLTLEESATFVAMCNNSSLFNPVRRNEKTRTRRNLVLDRTFTAGFINRATCEAAKKTALDVSKFKTVSHNDGLATYFRTTIAEDVKRLLKERGITKSDGSNYDVYRDGLKIYTTIEPQMQIMAEEALKEHMSALQAKFFRVWKGKDPWTYRDAETTDDMIRIRLGTLDAQIRGSDRYGLLRDKILDDLVSKIEDEFENFTLMDSDIINMLREEAKSGHFDAMMKTNSINPKRVDILLKILRGEYWRELRVRWNALQAQVKLDFNKPAKMKVFAYNAAGEKDTVMTPLDSIRYHKMHMQIGSLGVDPTSGHVKFWVGGVGHKYFQFDHVKSERQVGSTFKPFVYAAAIDLGMSPCKTIHDVAQTIGVGEGSFGLSSAWTPKNSGGYSGGYMNLWDALKESKNTASVALLKEMGSTTRIREIVNELGIPVDAKFANGQLRVPRNPAICLGAVDLQVFEMTGAYSAFANQGMFVRPMYISKITDKGGRVLYQGIAERRQALPKNVAYVMQRMLKYNVKAAPGVNSLKSDVGGKTGTTNDYRDGWFMGITPNLVVGTWVGGEDQWIRFLTIADGQGSAMARPFFAKFMNKVEKANLRTYDPNTRFTEPEGDLGIILDCSQYQETGPSGIPTESVPTEFNPNRFQDEEQSSRTPVPATPTKTPTTGNPSVPATKKKPKAVDDGFGGE
ncbi:MAG: transglycosylase domain-containing protein [Saprospiraceae bacterium]|nr:transglycosylase domain-containing protein [Saprospiraceae bacterium]